MAGEGQGGGLLVGALHSGLVVAVVPFGSDSKALGCRRGADQLHDGPVGLERAPAPVHRDEAEHAVLDLVPLRGAWRVVADRDLESGIFCQASELSLPGTYPVAVRPAGIGGDQKTRRVWEPGLSHGAPPTPDRLDGELGGVGPLTDRDPTLVVREVVNPVWDRPSELFVDEVMGLHSRRFSERMPL